MYSIQFFHSVNLVSVQALNALCWLPNASRLWSGKSLDAVSPSRFFGINNCAKFFIVSNNSITVLYLKLYPIALKKINKLY